MARFASARAGHVVSLQGDAAETAGPRWDSCRTRRCDFAALVIGGELATVEFR